MLNPLEVLVSTCAAAWCVLFNHTGILSRLRRRRLAYAYRPAGLFLAKMTAAGHPGSAVGCDDTLELKDLDGSAGHIDDAADVFYLSTHGRFLRGSGYSAILHTSIWTPGTSGLGVSRLIVAVFDTCSLIDGSMNWQSQWQSAQIASTVRILLGFDGPAPGDKGSAQRGAAFADELLAGKTFADSWLTAVKSTLVPGTGVPVALGIGGTRADASNVLATARLSALPAPRSGSAIYVHIQY
jgi:hypothetical protein